MSKFVCNVVVVKYIIDIVYLYFFVFYCVCFFCYCFIVYESVCFSGNFEMIFIKREKKE